MWRATRLLCLVLIFLVSTMSARQGVAVVKAPTAARESIRVDSDTVTILRDTYGVPHVFASTERGLFYGDGYAVAQDRLWQMERYRRDARGTLAEIEGRQAADRDA